VLEVYSDFRPAYERARFLEQEVLFNYQRALKLNESWLERNPNDAAALAGFTETQFTTGNFEECARRISAVLSDDQIDAKTNISLRALEIANLIALNRSAEISARIKSLVEVVESQPGDFKIQRSFAGIGHFIDANPQFAANKTWLIQLFAAMGGENREAILKQLPKN